MTTRLDSTITQADGQLESAERRLQLENSGCYATRDEENEAIHIFARDGSELYAVSAKVIPYESKSLHLTLQIYLIGHNNGRNTMAQEARQKIEKLADLMKLCV
jgi:hypothetical protein